MQSAQKSSRPLQRHLEGCTLSEHDLETMCIHMYALYIQDWNKYPPRGSLSARFLSVRCVNGHKPSTSAKSAWQRSNNIGNKNTQAATTTATSAAAAATTATSSSKRQFLSACQRCCCCCCCCGSSCYCYCWRCCWCCLLRFLQVFVQALTVATAHTPKRKTLLARIEGENQ